MAYPLISDSLYRFLFYVLLLIPGAVKSDAFPLAPLIVMAPDIPGMSEPGEIGRDVELVNAVLEACGWEAEFVYQPFGRHIRTFRDLSAADAVMTVPLSLDIPGVSTSAYIWYHNGAFYNASVVGPITTIDDLAGLRAVTFQNGIDILRLSDRVDEFELLLEVTDQTIHARMQLMGRVDVILADGLVVATLDRRIRSDRRFGESWPKELDDFVFYPVFNPTPYKMVFRSEELATQFDECFDRLSAKGRIVEINSKHIDQYQELLLHRYLGF